MSTSSPDKRPRLLDIVRNACSDFQKTWDSTEASAGFDPLASGVYRCLITDGGLFTSRTKKTPGYKVEFQVIAGPFAGRKVWFDAWLSSKALGVAKGELGKLGITRPEQLEQPLPPGLIADVTVVQQTDDNDIVFNRVKRFKIIDTGVPAADFGPDNLVGKNGDADAGYPSPADQVSTPSRTSREPGSDDDLNGNYLDDGYFDWHEGYQLKRATSAPLLDRPNRRRKT
jgi:hypothetical protein